ncbi:DEAD/DEAH box helicase family protein [Candidatus Pelagibacter sp.]|nr:DEAD/DEAH box helicase family protein [Candidatus Pelagibacter sp.]
MQERKIIQQSRSFKDLDRTLKKLIKHKKAKLAGSIFEYLTKLFLEVSPEYKTKLRKVYLLNEIPTAVKRKLKLPNTDEGIDLIAETFDNEYWAIQCKYRSDKTETLKVKGDLATFNNLAFTVCKNISHGLIAATVNRPPQKKQLLNVGYILLNEWLKLDRDSGELFNQIKAKSVGKIVKPKKLSPRPHQKEAISKTISYFKSNERGKMIMPCGTGKSLTAFWIAEKMKPKSILIAVPSLALLQQTLKVWTREFLLNNIEPDWLCVCSDDTVKEEQDDFVTFSADLGIKVDTDPRVIRKFLRKKTKKLKIVFTTYQSGRATAIGSKGFKYDLGIMDEAHKTVGSGKKPMAHLLHQKNININKRLFMTATERLFRGDSDEYMSMDDPRDYGNLIYELSFKEAINSKPPIISDYKIITFGITTPEIEKIAEDNKYLEVKKDLKDITARELATAIALRKAIKKLKIKNAISFHRSIKRAENFRKQQDLISKIYPTYGKLKTFHVRGDMPTSDRALEMLSFEEEKGLMTNARCLTEGVDLPAIDCVCFTDPKRSKVDIVQAAGRALRLAKGKKFGYILIPIFIPDGMDFDEAAEAQGFDDVSVTVRALATTDKRIVEYLRAISEGKKPKGGTIVEGITSVNSLMKIEAEEFDKAVKLKIWDKVAIGNYKTFNDAKKWVQKQKINSVHEWNLIKDKSNFPIDIPKAPQFIYVDEWKSWGDFFGTGYIATFYRKYLSYEETRNFLKENYPEIKTEAQWYNFTKSKKFPKNIRVAIRNDPEWKGMNHFLNVIKPKYYDYQDAVIRLSKLKIKSQNEYINYCKNKKISSYFPRTPQSIYKKNWNSWGDYLSTGNTATQTLQRNFYNISFENLQKIAKKNSIINMQQWFQLSKERKDIPRNPKNYSIYKKKWKGWVHFLGKNALRQRNYVSYDKFLDFLKKNNINTVKEWWNFRKKNKVPDIYPSFPNKIYNKSWKDIYGRRNFVKFNDAKKFAKSLKLKKAADWGQYLKNNKKPSNIPWHPHIYYKNKGWNGWGDFLGTGVISDHLKRDFWLSFKDAKKIIKKNKFKHRDDWFKFIKKKRPKEFPSNPAYAYKKEWKGWSDFLGMKPN